jgi:hypothetical protein
LHADIAELWSVPAIPDRIAELADWRWQAAALFQKWQLIRDDLDQLRGILLPMSESTWLRLLATAADFLTWDTAPDGQSCWLAIIDEAYSLDHLARDLPYVFDRLDYLKALASDWQNWFDSNVGETELMPLVVLAWTRPPEEVRPALMQFADRICELPIHWFQRLKLAAKGAVALVFLANQVRLLPCIDNDQTPAMARADGIEMFLTFEFWSQYWDYHQNLLEFCLSRRLAPAAVAEVATAQGLVFANGGTPMQIVLSDGAINLVYYAVQRVGC